jgi:hypothetical protein
LDRDERSIRKRPPLAVADGPEGKEGSPPDSPGDHHPLGNVASDHGGGAEDPLNAAGAERTETLTLPDVIMAILDCRSRFPQAASAALIREPEDEDEFVYIVLLDENRQPIFVEPGTITAATYVTRHLGEDLAAAFGDKKAIVLKLIPAVRGAGRATSRPATAARPQPARCHGASATFHAVETNRRIDVYTA